MRWLGFLALAGCVQYAQHRAALVPHATPVQTTGQPQQTRATFGLGMSQLAEVAPPGDGDQPDGIAIPTKQVRGSIGLAITPNATMSFMYEQGVASSAHPTRTTLPPLDDEAASGRGLGFSYSIETSVPSLRIGIATELMTWSLPWVAYTTCVMNCIENNPPTIVEHGRSSVPTMGVGVTPSYRTKHVTYFGGVSLRNHPTLEEKVINYGESPDVSAGPGVVTFVAGAAFEIDRMLQLVVDLHQTVPADPAAYSPGVGVSIVVGFGDPPARRPKVPPYVLVPVPQRVPPGLTLVPASNDQAWALTKQAAEAARTGDCPAAQAISARVKTIDAEFYDIVLVRDVAIARCLTTVGTADNLARRAIDAAQAGDCATARAFSHRVRALDPGVHATVLATNEAIVRCLP